MISAHIFLQTSCTGFVTRCLPTSCFTAILSAFIFVSPSAAMLIRHDVDPDKYIVEEADYPAVFPVLETKRLKDCVATLIAPQWAITAAHCLTLLYENDFGTSPYTVSIAGTENVVVDAIWPEQLGALEIRKDSDGNIIGRSLDVPDFSDDVALLKLDTPVTHVDPIALYESEDEVGKIVTLLGWGDFGMGDKGIPKRVINDKKFRQATNQITKTKKNYLFFDFDSPRSGKALPLEGVNGPGDSGGPALVSTNSGPQIIGISSGGRYRNPFKRFTPQGQYGWQEYYVRVSQIRDWIEKVIEESNE